MSPDGITQARPTRTTRDLILDAADEFLTDHPFRDLTVSGLMQATSVSRPAFYQYFRDRYDIAAALIDRIAEAVMGAGQDWLSGSADPIPGCSAGVHAYVANVSPYAYVIRAICDAAAADDRIDRLWRQGLMQRYMDAVSRRIRSDQATGNIPAEVDPDLTAQALVMLTERFTCDCLGKPQCASDDKFAEVLARMWCATLYGTY
jgi:TetR/AcrR family transcriptional regulator, ethionamide resistance regulator